MLYLHTPMRALYDLKDHFLEKSNPASRLALKKFASYWTPKDKIYMSKFDRVGTNSQNVKNRVMKYYGKNLYNKASVVYTGIDTKKYRYVRSGDFYLSAARLDPLKRIDMIIRAFKKTPDRKLIIAGSGPEEGKLKKLAKDCKNIEFLGSVNDKELLDLYSTCRATIAANVDEDLGLIAIESHASGKPIAVINEGGFLETVNSGNGVFFKNESDIGRSLDELEKTKWNPKTIQKSAQKYDIKEFTKRIVGILDAVVKD